MSCVGNAQKKSPTTQRMGVIMASSSCWHFETHGVGMYVYCVRHCLYRHRKSPLRNSFVKLTQCSLFFCMWKCMCMSVCVCACLCVGMCECARGWLWCFLLLRLYPPTLPSMVLWRMSILYYCLCPRPAVLSCVCLHSHGICWFLSIRHVVDSFIWQNISAPKGPSSVEKKGYKTNQSYSQEPTNTYI